PLRSYSGNENVVRLFHNNPSCFDGVTNVPQKRDASTSESPAVHYGGVSFDFAEQIESRTCSSIEDRIVLHCDHGSLNRVQCTPFFQKNLEAKISGLPDAIKRRFVKSSGTVQQDLARTCREILAWTPNPDCAIASETACNRHRRFAVGWIAHPQA